ncbi:MAG TPA: baseplate J/gp47 family protein, partial [Candidatus Nitrosotalea sp.]|nr:baseplate J/gp47 family protein [Candidatus Nitrosotalea sp.]
ALPSYQIQPGQDFTATNGQVFTDPSTSAILPPGQSGNIPVTAVNAGAAGNVGSGTITVINGNSAACLVVTNQAGATGGADAKSNPQITSGDVQGAQATMDQDLRRQIAADFTKQVQSGEKLSDAIVFQPPSFSTDHAPGDQVASFNATMTLKAEGAFYNASQAQKALVAAARAKVPAGQQMTDGTPQVTYTVTGTSGGHLTFTGTVGSYVAQQLDLQQIKSQVVAKSVSQARATLAKLPVNSAEIVQSPFKLPWMPLLGSRVKVNYVVQQGSAAAAPAA